VEGLLVLLRFADLPGVAALRSFSLPRKAISYGREPPGLLTVLLTELVLLCLATSRDSIISNVSTQVSATEPHWRSTPSI
jgi:hypothetical protein